MRRLLVLVSAIVFLDAMLYGALGPLVPGYAAEFGLSKGDAGLLVGSFGAGALVGGIPGGLVAARLGPRRAVILGLLLFAVGGFAFALADSALLLGLARLLQGLSSAITWSGALSWIVVSAPRERRGELLGTAFGIAVFGALLGPMFGGLADAVGPRPSFAAVGVVGLALAAWAIREPELPPEPHERGAIGRALREPRFLAGLWLNALPAALFGVMMVLVPLALDEHGFAPFAIGAVFLAAGLTESLVNPMVGRFSDRRGRLLPLRLALGGSIVTATGFALFSSPAATVVLVALAGVTYGALYTPGMALTSDGAEHAKLSQGLAFGVMNSAWALGNLGGPAVGGALAGRAGDWLPYVLSAVLCAGTLALLRSGGNRSSAQVASSGLRS